MITDYRDPGDSPRHRYYVMVSIWRHDSMLCEPSKYRVIQYNGPHFNAVMDDFGTLVEVA